MYVHVLGIGQMFVQTFTFLFVCNVNGALQPILSTLLRNDIKLALMFIAISIHWRENNKDRYNLFWKLVGFLIRIIMCVMPKNLQVR